MTSAELETFMEDLFVDTWRSDFMWVDRFSYLLGARSALLRSGENNIFQVIDTFAPVFEQCQARQYHGEKPGEWS